MKLIPRLKNLYAVGVISCICVMMLSGFMVYRYYANSKANMKEFEKLARLIEYLPASEETSAENVEIGAQPLLANYSELHLQNTDMVGWIKIEGTTVNYPVMQTPNDPDYYLKRNFTRTYSEYGVPYAGALCDVFLPSDNVVIHGHNINDGSMFGSLRNYGDMSFWEDHRFVRFDTLAEPGEYLIFAVFKTVVNNAGSFEYYNFANAEDEDDFDAYVSQCKELSMYDTGISAQYGDKLLTLSTCEAFNVKERLVVVAKKL